MAGWTVVLRGIRYRSGRSLMVLILAGIATAATVLAPAYSRAAQQSVLSDGLRSAPADATSLQVRSDPISGEPPALESSVWSDTSDRYIRAYERITATPFERGSYPVAPRLVANLG